MIRQIEIMDFILEHVKWIFSGVGVAVIAWLFARARRGARHPILQSGGTHSQVAGNVSTAYQAGRDIIVNQAQAENKAAESPKETQFAPTKSNAIRAQQTGHSQHSLLIHSATYGAQGQVVDVTRILMSRVSNGQLKVLASIDLAGDPIYGLPKYLTVEYSYDDRRDVKTVREGDSLSLP